MPRRRAILPLLAILLVPSTSSGAWTHPEFFARLAADSTRSIDLIGKALGDSALGVMDTTVAEVRRQGDRTELTAALRVHATIASYVPRPTAGLATVAEAESLALASSDSLEVLRCARTRASLLAASGQLEPAYAEAQRSLAMARRLGYDDEIAWSAFTVTSFMFREAKFQDALPYYREAVDHATRAAAPLILLRSLRWELLSVGRLGDMATARDLSTRLRAEIARYPDNYETPYARIAVAFYESQAGDPGEALKLIREAADTFRARGAELYLAFTLRELGGSELDLDQLQAAEQHLTEARALDEKLGLRVPLALLHVTLANLYQAQNRFVDAEREARAGLAAGDTIEVLGQARSLVWLSYALCGQGRAGEAVREVEARRPALLPRATGEALIALDVAYGLALLQADRPSEALPYLKNMVAVGEAMKTARYGPYLWAFIARAYRQLGDWSHADSSLAMATQALQARRAQTRAAEARESWNSIDELFGEMVLHELERPNASAQARTIAAFDSLQRFRTRTLIERLTGTVADPAHSPPPVTVTRLQTTVLRPGELLLESLATDDSSWVFAVTRDTCAVVGLPRLPVLTERIQVLRDLVAAPPADSSTRLSRETLASFGEGLFGPLVPLMQQSQTVLFAPDGPLHLVPLAALPLGAGGAALLEDHRVIHVPSATMLALLRERAPPTAPDARLLAFIGGGTEGPQGLAGARAEVEQLRNSYRDVEVRAASTIRAWDDAPHFDRYAAIHFAGHTAVDDDRPWRSGIQLRGGADSSAMWRAESIAAVPLRATLVVLSSCQSEGNRALSGEGVAGLSTAFLAAGVPTVVATLWPVEDRATAKFMQSFYAALADGQTAEDALRAAQKIMRSDPATAHPFYWAGFVVVGADGAKLHLERLPAGARPETAGGLPLILLALAGALIAVGVIVFFVLRRRAASA